jgi:hypothetical protein
MLLPASGKTGSMSANTKRRQASIDVTKKSR